MTALLAAARAVHFASLMAIFGGSAYALLLERAGLWGSASKSTRAYFSIAAALGAASGIVWFCLIAGQMSGSWEGSLDPAIIEMTALSTRFGNVFLMRFLGLGALWFACALRVRSQGLAISLLAGLLLASLGPISHAAAASSDTLSIGAISDAAHLLTAGFWLGGLVVLAMFLRRNREDQASLLGALRLFSTWGSLAVAMLVITGSINAISILPVQDMSLDSAYFDLLLVKVGLASVMIGLAALNRWHFVPALRTDGERAIQHLLASVVGEIGLAIGIVSIVGLLGLMAPH